METTNETCKNSDSELFDLAIKLLDHLDWIGWGDSWERECSEDLRKKAWKVIDKYKVEVV